MNFETPFKLMTTKELHYLVTGKFYWLKKDMPQYVREQSTEILNKLEFLIDEKNIAKDELTEDERYY
jgi:hypothetical protein